MSQDRPPNEASQEPPKRGFGAPEGTIAGRKGPGQNIINYIWGTIVSGILLVFLGSGAGIVISIFVGKDANAIQPLITLFTATLGFLAGVLTPSPVGNQGGQQQES